MSRRYNFPNENNKGITVIIISMTIGSYNDFLYLSGDWFWQNHCIRWFIFQRP